jgi:hypothetical protein
MVVERLAHPTKNLTFGGRKHCLGNMSVDSIRIPRRIVL